MISKMVAEHANVPPRCPRHRRTEAGNFGKFRYRKCLRNMVAEHANVPPRCPATAGPTRGILANSATGIFNVGYRVR
jgi:hypothetical protein